MSGGKVAFCLLAEGKKQQWESTIVIVKNSVHYLTSYILYVWLSVRGLEAYKNRAHVQVHCYVLYVSFVDEGSQMLAYGILTRTEVSAITVCDEKGTMYLTWSQSQF